MFEVLETRFSRPSREERMRKTISSAWLSLISTLAASWWKILIERSPFSFAAVSVANGTISFLRDDVENRKVGRETGGRKDRTRSHRKERRLPLLPFSSSLTIYPFGTTAHPPTFYRAIPPILVCIHRITAPCLIPRHCFLFISSFSIRLVFNGFFNSAEKIKRERKIKIRVITLEWSDRLMVFFFGAAITYANAFW